MYFLYNPKKVKEALFVSNSSNVFEKNPTSPFYKKFKNYWRQIGIIQDLKKDEIHACKYMTKVQSFFLTKYIYPNDCNHFLGSPYLGSKELYDYFKSNELFEYYDNEYSLRHPFCGECLS